MKNIYANVLVAILVLPTFSLTAECVEPSVAIITGEVRDPTSREIILNFQSPLALGRSSEQRVILDSHNRFAITIPLSRANYVVCRYPTRRPTWKWMGWIVFYVFGPPDPIALFVEPGDSLHVVVEPGYFSPSLRFSGENADNSRFMSGWIPRFRRFQRGLDYQDLKAEDFSRKIAEWRRDQSELLAEAREKYALSPAFIDFATIYFTYGFGRFLISYPTQFSLVNGYENKDIPPEYYDFLLEISLVNEEAIGVGNYRTFLVRTLGWELSKDPKPQKLSDVYDLSGLGLSEKTLARLDSLYEQTGRKPLLSQMVDFSQAVLSPANQVRLDSMYKNRARLRLSKRYDLGKMGVAPADHGRIDSFYAKAGRGLRITTSNKITEPELDTTSGAVELYLPMKEGSDAGEQLDSFNRTPGLSEKVDLSSLGLSPPVQAQLDSLYVHRQPLRLSEKVDLTDLDLTDASRTRLDSIYANSSGARGYLFAKRYDLAKRKLSGRVLYWFLAGELIDGFRTDGDAFALATRKWQDFTAINPYAEYTDAVQAALNKAMALRPGRHAPDFTLTDLDGHSVSLSQFRGKVVFMDFWASWCGPCIANLPFLRSIKKRSADLPVVFVNLSLDESDSAWRKAIEKHKIKGVHVRTTGSAVAKLYNVLGVPSYFLVDPQGRIVEQLTQLDLMDTDSVAEKIKETLGSV
ncbi:MAG: TlpA family protein disulfide reductase [Candidatus Latescibacteria bacterium]|nr:TlpA family protein disulfide reductase [Candidatus Latescibacterota bacterium]